MTCPNCGGKILGDGHTVVRHCEEADAETVLYSEPDANTIYCPIFSPPLPDEANGPGVNGT